MDKFGDRLRFLRQINGKTQEELGLLIGASKTAIHNYETGNAMPSTQKIVELASILHVNVDFLIGASDRMHASKAKYEVQRKFPLIARQDVGNLPEFIVTAACGYIDAPVEDDSSECFAVELEENGISYTVIVKRGLRDAEHILCQTGSVVHVLPQNQIDPAKNKVIGAVVFFV